MRTIQTHQMGNQDGVKRLGKMLLESMSNAENIVTKEKWDPVYEKVMTESSMGDQDSLYTTMIASFIEEAFAPEMIANKVIREVSLDVRGTQSIKIPKAGLLTAQTVDQHGEFIEDQTGYTDIEIEIGWIACRTGLPIPLIRACAVDLIAERLGEIGLALATKVDADILTQMVKAGTKNDATYGDNSNYLYAGSSAYLTFDRLVEAIAGHKTLKANPDAVVMHPSSWARLMKDTDVKGAIRYSISPDGKVVFVENFGGVKIYITTQITSGKIALVDTKRNGYFLRGSGIETWDGREDNTIRIEVVGAMSYGVGIVRPHSVYLIHENATEP